MSRGIRPTRRLEDVRIGGRVAARRKECNLTLAEVAILLNLTEDELADREAGKRGFLASELYRLAGPLNVLPGWFLDNLELNASEEPF